MNRPVPTALGWRLPSWLLDYGPVAFIVLVGLASITVRPAGAAGGSARWLVVGLAITAGALLARHRAPLVVLALVLGVVLWLDYAPVVILPTLLAVFTIAEYRDRRTVVIAAVIAAGVVILAEPLHSHPQAAGQVISHIVVVGLAVAVGLWLRARADYVSGLRDRAEQADRERELREVKAVGDERVRIARELHDVVAHNVSLMVVQAQALEATTSDRPEHREALRHLAGLGRDALSEMHRMLGVLRLEEPGDAERAPQPGVRDLGTLVERTVQAGLDVRLAVEGEARELPPAVDLSTYRIVQEALTNVIRHAHAQHVRVTLRYSPRELRLTVVDDGVGAVEGATNGALAGHGLVGMRERVALFGGRLETGPRQDGGGYRVDASLPIS